MLLLKCITLCLGTVHLLSRVTWSQRGGALTGLQPCAWTCLDMCPDMSGHSQNGVITEENAKIFAPAAGFCLRRRLRRASQNPVSTSTGSP